MSGFLSADFLRFDLQMSTSTPLDVSQTWDEVALPPPPTASPQPPSSTPVLFAHAQPVTRPSALGLRPHELALLTH